MYSQNLLIVHMNVIFPCGDYELHEYSPRTCVITGRTYIETLFIRIIKYILTRYILMKRKTQKNCNGCTLVLTEYEREICRQCFRSYYGVTTTEPPSLA